LVMAMNTAMPDLGALLSRHALSKALADRGFPVPLASLATMASRGGGPPFMRFGTRVLYRWADALAWAQGRLRGPMSSTSEVDTSQADRLPCQPTVPAADAFDAAPDMVTDEPRPRDTAGVTGSAEKH
jgi:hypothetical protein